MNYSTSAYGLWALAIINSAIFIIFAFSFTHPHTKRDWRSFGAFSAFIVALFTEMYGFPLTIYLLSGCLATRYPDMALYTHDNGHLWHTLLGLKAIHISMFFTFSASFSSLAVLFCCPMPGESCMQLRRHIDSQERARIPMFVIPSTRLSC